MNILFFSYLWNSFYINVSFCFEGGEFLENELIFERLLGVSVRLMEWLLGVFEVWEWRKNLRKGDFEKW